MKRGKKYGMLRKRRYLPYAEHRKVQDIEDTSFEWVKEQQEDGRSNPE